MPDAAILIEDQSTNCGENAEFPVDLLKLTPLRLRSVLLLQDPTMQRRTHECFRRFLRDAAGVRVLSYAPFVPTVPDRDARNVHDEDGRAVWSMRRFTALTLGEMCRLHDDEHGYGPRGADFIDHLDIPSDVMDAYQRLAVAHPHSVSETWRPKARGPWDATSAMPRFARAGSHKDARTGLTRTNAMSSYRAW